MFVKLSSLRLCRYTLVILLHRLPDDRHTEAFLRRKSSCSSDKEYSCWFFEPSFPRSKTEPCFFPLYMGKMLPKQSKEGHLVLCHLNGHHRIGGCHSGSRLHPVLLIYPIDLLSYGLWFLPVG